MALLGPTGELAPDWPISESDEGGLRFMVATDHGRVILDFGTAVHWIGMEAHQAEELAAALLEQAAKLKA